jgi:hypothetical protein
MALSASPTFTGTPAAPTAAAGTNTTQIATTAFVTAAQVAGAGAITNPGGWSVTPSGTTLFFNYNGTNVAKLDSSGNFTAKANVTAYGTV